MKKKENQRRGSKYSQRMKNKPTREEHILGREFQRRGIIFFSQRFSYDSDHLFLLDFLVVCKGKFRKLGIEIDGKSHEKQRLYDFKRTVWFWKRKGIKIIRFTNEQVQNNLAGVMESIEAYQPKLKTERELDNYCARFHQPVATDENGFYKLN